MRLGIFAKTFPRTDADGCLAAISAAGIAASQFNLSVVGLPTIPTEPVPDRILAGIRAAADRYRVRLVAISGTFNAAHPDPAARRRDVERFPLLCAAAGALDVSVVTLSSGSRDPDDLWRRHPDNDGAAAWADSRATLRALAAIAEQHELSIAVEPEHGTVVSTAERAAIMLAEVGSPALGVVYDAANLLDPQRWDPSAAELAIAADIATLAPHLLLAHAKELTADGAPAAPGAGLLPWTRIVTELASAGFDRTLVIHGLAEPDVGVAVRTLTDALAAADDQRDPQAM